MKALGIPQPGAWLIINGYHARVPLPAPTQHRGNILIYALPDPIAPTTFEQFLAGCRQLHVTSHPKASDFELGGFLGTARLVACEIDEGGGSVAVLESADELGFAPSSGHLGIFDVSDEPFTATDLPRADYSSHALARTTSSTPSVSDEAHPNGPSFLDHFMGGVEQQARRELNKSLKKLGRGLTKDAINIGAELLGGWLGGGKPRGGRRR
jgi:hypothetical protein